MLQLNKPFPYQNTVLFLLGNKALPQSQNLIFKKLKFMFKGMLDVTATTECLILPPIHAKYQDFFQTIPTELEYKPYIRKTHCSYCDSPQNSHICLID